MQNLLTFYWQNICVSLNLFEMTLRQMWKNFEVLDEYEYFWSESWVRVTYDDWLSVAQKFGQGVTPEIERLEVFHLGQYVDGWCQVAKLIFRHVQALQRRQFVYRSKVDHFVLWSVQHFKPFGQPRAGSWVEYQVLVRTQMLMIHMQF